jgi:hypothetical protein
MSSEHPRLRILARAAEVTGGERADSYGPVRQNLENIATLFSAYLSMKHRVDVPLSGEDVAWMLTLLKMARSSAPGYHEDNYVDAAAYSAIAGECRGG